MPPIDAPNVAGLRKFAARAKEDRSILKLLTQAELEQFYDYSFLWQLRPAQQYDRMFADWDEIANLSGRGCGKSFSGAAWLIYHAIYEAPWGSCSLLMGPTHKYFQDTIKGDNNLAKLAPKSEGVYARLSDGPGWFFPRRNHWVLFASAEVPDAARGPNYTAVMFEEMCQNAASKVEYIYEATALAVRKGKPKTLISTTPKPSKWLSKKVKDKTVLKLCESTFANSANLAPSYLEKMKRIFGNSLFGQQELFGKVLDSSTSLMFDEQFKKRSNIDWRKCRYMAVSIDPANAEKKNNDETGIIIYGVIDTDEGQKLIVYEDLSGRHNPSEIVSLLKAARARYGATVVRGELRGGALGYIVAETNSGGHWVIDALAEVGIPILNNHSVESKPVRVENANPAWQGGQILLNGEFPELEDQLEDFTAGTVHDDRVDALTQAVYDAFDLWNPHRGQERSFGGLAA